ncbi:MAG: hypothetical protein ACJ75A_04125, partial [Actinomycetes bacterium]
RQLADLSRPGALEAGLNWYRANNNPAHFAATDPTRFDLPSVDCPTMGVWSSRDFALTEAQMTLSEPYVNGPWRYRFPSQCAALQGGGEGTPRRQAWC